MSPFLTHFRPSVLGPERSGEPTLYMWLAAPLRWMAGPVSGAITLQNPPQYPAVLLPERFRAETCAFGALIEEGLSDRVWSIGERVA